ncbi:hypothetical protein ACLK15_05270 [Escherichia coli]
MSCRFVWKSKTKWWQKPSNARKRTRLSAEAAELEVDELKSQLADYQQALDVQQTRAIQYNQAIAALNRAKELCHLPTNRRQRRRMAGNLPGERAGSD